MELNLVSLLGLVLFIALAWACSFHRKHFPWRTVFSGLALQFIIALIILKTSPGRELFVIAQKAAHKLIDVSVEGAKMVFGPLANETLLAEKLGPGNAFIFVVVVSATIIVVSAISSLLYHWGVLQLVVRGAAWVMQRVMKTSGSESLAAAANIFMGQTEAPLVVRPYLAGMTRSEIMALMTGGMATIAGGVFAAYVAFGIDAGHLLTASVMSAPASLMLAKVLLPETETSETVAGASATVKRETSNSLDAICHGAGEGVKLSLNVMAMLIAFVAIVALVNYLLSAPQTFFGVADPVTLQKLFGWVNAPFAWLLGVPAKDCVAVGQVLGERIVLNEFIGYFSLKDLKETLDPRSFTIATYALCGFANFSSIAIQIGGIGSLAPNRRADLASLGVRAMLGGVLASYLTATIAGILL
ncbi:MAG TPA: nucleoside transporter C-terminal domain-containing protein [Verrucomicrobiota bacterium]|nr:nucleoside transporter C-terminal domain-containing protein [Verrucomicrobiota bacterium]